MSSEIKFKYTRLPEDENFQHDLSYLLKKFRYERNIETVEQIFIIANPMMFFKKPKWYQWRLRRKYHRILETK